MRIYEPAPRQILRLLTTGLPGAHRKYYAIESEEPERIWLFKPQSEAQMAVDVAAAQTAAAAGIPSPIVYPIWFRLGRQLYQGSIQPLVSQVAAHGLPRYGRGLTSAQWESLQRHQVLDWLLGNPDTHREQSMILRDGSLISVDKSQALRLFPHDELNWDPPRHWPNIRRSAYRYLFLAAEKQQIELDPEVAFICARDLAEQITNDWLRETWFPVVSRWPLSRLRQAVGARSLATAADVAAAVERVLTALVARKEGLEAEFRRLYFQRSRNRWSEEDTL